MPKRKDGQPNRPPGTTYTCGVCGKSFGNSERDCKRHMWEVHGTVNPVPVIRIDEQGRQHRLLATATEGVGNVQV
jgi:hypothetical protein